MDFREIAEGMRLRGMQTPDNKVHIRIDNATAILRVAFAYFLSVQSPGAEMQWKSEYDSVGQWLENNQGKGLLLHGPCGLGKTLLARYCLPAIILKYARLIVNTFDTQDMNRDPEKVLSKHLIGIDDFGTEDVSVAYGNKRMVLTEVLDMAEKKGKLLILTTNLSGDQIAKKYGARAYDRILSVTTRVRFDGKTLRG